MFYKSYSSMPGKSDAITKKYVNMGKFCISFDFLNDIWNEELDQAGRLDHNMAKNSPNES
jgi:hypothetical protein